MKRTLEQAIEVIANGRDGYNTEFDRMGYLVLLPLLQFPHRAVRIELERAVASNGFDEASYGAISWSDLVVFAFSSVSGYWGGLAVAWLVDGFPVDTAILEAGDALISGKKGTQAERHALFRVLRRWERSQGLEGKYSPR